MHTTQTEQNSHLEVERSPLQGVPFLDSFRVAHGPIALLGRFFLHADEKLRDDGVTLSFASFEEVAGLRSSQKANWSFFNPMFNPAISDIPPDRAFCVVCRDRTGTIVGTGAAKLLDARHCTLKEVVDGGDFYGVRPHDNPTGIR